MTTRRFLSGTYAPALAQTESQACAGKKPIDVIPVRAIQLVTCFKALRECESDSKMADAKAEDGSVRSKRIGSPGTFEIILRFKTNIGRRWNSLPAFEKFSTTTSCLKDIGARVGIDVRILA